MSSNNTIHIDKKRYIELITKAETLHRLTVGGVKEWSQYESALTKGYEKTIDEYKEAIAELLDCIS